jgi:hypothetical protein
MMTNIALNLSVSRSLEFEIKAFLVGEIGKADDIKHEHKAK